MKAKERFVIFSYIFDILVESVSENSTSCSQKILRV